MKLNHARQNELTYLYMEFPLLVPSFYTVPNIIFLVWDHFITLRFSLGTYLLSK